MNKSIKLCGLGNAVVDLIVETTDSELKEFGYEKSSQALQEPVEQEALLAKVRSRRPTLVSGGSVANSIFALAELGGSAALIGMVGDDNYGMHYKNEADNSKIKMINPFLVGEATGTCISLITPDAERTMLTCLGAAARVTPDHVAQSQSLIRDAEWLLIEGYLFGNPWHGVDAIMKAVEIARTHETKIAITFSESWVVEHFRKPVDAVLQHTSLVFANEREATAYTSETDPLRALAGLSEVVANVVLTRGEAGATGVYNRHKFSVPAYPCAPVDLTGAGDVFAGTFLHLISSGQSPELAAKAGCYMARAVITQRGARISTGMSELFNEFSRTA